MNKERNITHSIRVKIILLAFLLASSLMIFHDTAHAAEKPGNVSFLQVKTYKARKGLSKKKYDKNYRLVVLYWSKASNAGKYQLLYSYKKNGSYKKAVKNPVAGTPSGSWLSCKLAYKKDKTVYFKVVPYNGTTAGNTSTWVSVKAGNTKKNARSVIISGSNATIYAGDSKSYSAVVKPKKPVVKGVRWISSNSSIAKVDSKGRVTGVSKGTATIYAMAHNGLKKSVKVTVLKLDVPQITVQWGVKSSKITWTSVSGADGYEIRSQVTRNGSVKTIASVGASARSYTDTYYNGGLSTSFNGVGSYLKYTYYLDPTVNPLIYSVRAFKKVGKATKYSASREDFHLEAPTLARAEKLSGGKVELTWGKSPLATGYIIYKGNGEAGGWERIGTRDATPNVVIKKEVDWDSAKPYYTVKAYATMNGKTVYSDFDTSFHIDKRNYANKKILFIGDSITFGTPYTGTTSSNDPYYCGSSDRYLFSWPRRLSQMTGVSITNLSVAGATYTYMPSFTDCKEHRCLTLTSQEKENHSKAATYKKDGQTINEYYRDKPGSEALTALIEGGNVYKSTVDMYPSAGSVGGFADYDVVVLAAGTNDARYVPENGILGDMNDVDNSSFTGAVNSIMSAIAAANEKRPSDDPIKVVFVDLFYRANKGSPSASVMKTYQDRLHAIADMWNGDSGIKVYKCNESSSYINASNADQLTSDYLHLTRFAQGQFGAKMADYMIKEGILK
jgi:lysophospholipase L1-like esterase